MKSTKEQKLKSLGTDESIGVQEFDNSCRKEKKVKTEKIEMDTDAMMTSNEGRVGEKRKRGKKGHKEDTEDAIVCKEEKVKKKKTKDNVMVPDDDKRQSENQEKKKSKKDKKDDILNECEDKREKEKRKKKKKDRSMSFDEEAGVKHTKEEETAVVEGKDERNVERKKEKKDAVLNGCEDERKTEKRKKKKKDHSMSFDEETGVKHTKEEETAVVEGKDERNAERKKEKKDATKADKKEKKRKEKETKDDITAGDEEHEKKAKEKKENVKESGDEVEGGKETNGGEEKKKKEKKRKEKATKDDITAGDEEHKKKAKEKKENVKERGDEVEGGKETNGGEEKKKKEKRRKEKLPKDDMEVGDEEQKKKVKEKKENVAILKGNHSGNKAELLEGKQDGGKKRKRDKEDSVGKAESEGQTTSKKAIAGDSSKQPKPKSKKVRFAGEVETFPPADPASESDGTEDDGLVRGKRFTKEEDALIIKAVYDYIEANHLGEEGLDMVLHVKHYTKLMYCWNEIAAALPWRPVGSVYSRGHVLFERSEHNEWTPEELEHIITSHEKYGASWKVIGKDMGKFRIHVKDAYRRHKSGHLNRGNWSQEEIQKLFELVNKDLQMKLYEEKKSKHGMLRDNICWEAISTELGTRRFSACCQKWYNQLASPMVADGTWADADDYRLVMALVDLDASCEEEVDWDFLLEHRSGEVCLRRWKQMVNHLGEHGNKSFSEQVEVLSNRYCPDLVEVREALDARPIVD